MYFSKGYRLGFGPLENHERLRIGLCFDCAFRRIVEGGRSTFYLCERSFTDPAFPKYPRLPVVACLGYERDVTTTQSDKLTE